MRFKPFSKAFEFNKGTLVEDFPNYLIRPLERWIMEVVDSNDLGYTRYLRGPITSIKEDLANDLQVTLHIVFPRPWNEFLGTVFSDPDILCNFLSLMLQNYCEARDATNLEMILSRGGSAYSVEKTNKDASVYTKGVYCLVRRVPGILKTYSQEALSANQILQEAWNDCYKHNPSYSDVVSKCNDFLEGFFRDLYWPEDKRTKSILQCIKEFQKDPSKLTFKGSGFLKDKTNLISLLDGIATIRAQHTTGTGKTPKPDEAEYILHTSIYIWTLMKSSS